MGAVKTQPVMITSRWFQMGYDKGLHGTAITPTEKTLVDIVRRTVHIALDDGEISEDQLRYEVGLLVGTLLAGETSGMD